MAIRVDLLVSSKHRDEKHIAHNPEETVSIGFRLGRTLNPGDVVGLYGGLGAGKTTMTKGIGGALGIHARDIASASFTIIAEYDTDPPFSHIDLYRVEGESELFELGIRDHIGGNRVSVIEWAEKAEHEMPSDAIRVTITEIENGSREITIKRANEKGRDNL